MNKLKSQIIAFVVFTLPRFLDILAARKDPAGLLGEVLVDRAPQPPNFKCLSGYVVQVQCFVLNLQHYFDFNFYILHANAAFMVVFCEESCWNAEGICMASILCRRTLSWEPWRWERICVFLQRCGSPAPFPRARRRPEWTTSFKSLVWPRWPTPRCIYTRAVTSPFFLRLSLKIYFSLDDADEYNF